MNLLSTPLVQMMIYSVVVGFLCALAKNLAGIFFPSISTWLEQPVTNLGLVAFTALVVIYLEVYRR